MVPVEVGCEHKGWRCTTCRVRGLDWDKLAPAKCTGSRLEAWAARAKQEAEECSIVGGGHRRVQSGEVAWCQVCGCYADSRVRGLTEYCKGKPTSTCGGGRAGQLLYLRNNIHPRTRKPLPPPVDEQGRELGGLHCYPELARRSPKVEQGAAAVTYAPPEVPASMHAPARHEGKSAAQKHLERLERVRAIERANKPARRRLRGKQKPDQA